jgi:N-acetyl-gamma-glutamyl-phosphate reductase
MKPIVFIDGDQGTTGLQIRSRLESRADIDLMVLPEDLRKDAGARAETINCADIAILCLPDTAARAAVAAVHNPSVRIIDASSAHRTCADWTYGFPEMSAGQADRIRRARRVSNPGCYPSGAIALLRPLIEAKLLPADYPLVINAVSGYSGGGRSRVNAFERAGLANCAAQALAFQVYGLGLDHKHTPEIQTHAGLALRPVFIPAYGNFRQGIVLTIALHLRLMANGSTAQDLQSCLADRYDDQPHIRVHSLAQAECLDYLDPQALNGSNQMQLAVFSNTVHGQVMLSAVFDNLGKGASGAAVQNLDLMLGSR